VSAPVPQAPNSPATPKAQITLEHAEALARENNIVACRDATQQARRAGVPLPAGLIALAGLRLELLQQVPPR
jgi:hypothetical protein